MKHRIALHSFTSIARHQIDDFREVVEFAEGNLKAEMKRLGKYVGEKLDGLSDDEQREAADWYADADGDGYTAATEPMTACGPPDGYAAASASPDCNDAESSVHPGADDVAGDGVDQDCEGGDAATSGEENGGGPAAADGGCGSLCGGGGAGAAILAFGRYAADWRRRRVRSAGDGAGSTGRG